MAELPLDQYREELGCTVGEELLKPTRLYAHDLVAMFDAGLRPHGITHITGGGWTGNINRVSPDGLCAACEKAAVPVRPVIDLIRQLGNIAEDEMYRAFNMGLGMALVAPAETAETFSHFLSARGVPTFRMGYVERGADTVRVF